MALQHLRNANQDTYVLFVDLVKAFDSVNREMLWKILAKFGLPENLISVIKKMYTDIKITTTSGNASTEFPSTSGVKQGDNLAPILFLFIIQAVSENLDKQWGSIARPELSEVRNGVMNRRENRKGQLSKFYYNKSFYADDGAFIFLTRKDVEAGSKLVAREFARLGMEVHLGIRGTNGSKDVKSKTEALFVPSRSNKNPDDPLATADIEVSDGRYISFCDVFQYLGTLISADLKEDCDIETRIKKARSAFAMMRPVLKNHRLRLELRVQLYMQIPMNIVLWGCDSWALREDHIRKLDRFHHDCIRSILGFSRRWHKERGITMEDLRKKTGVGTMKQLVTDRTLRFLEKIAGMPETRLTRRMLHSQCEVNEENGPLKRGRAPSTTKGHYLACLALAKLTRDSKDKKIRMQDWTEQFLHPDIRETIETNLGMNTQKQTLEH